MLDEAGARRASLLKRYGDRTATSGPVAVKMDAAAADAEKMANDEANHNEIWGDCEFNPFFCLSCTRNSLRLGTST